MTENASPFFLKLLELQRDAWIAVDMDEGKDRCAFLSLYFSETPPHTFPPLCTPSILITEGY